MKKMNTEGKNGKFFVFFYKEAATGGFLSKKVSLKISKNLPGNTRVGMF